MRSQFSRELQELRAEVSPILRHAIVVITLGAAFAAIGLLLHGLRVLFPSHAGIIAFLATVDVWLVAAIFCLFAVYTITILTTRLWRSITHEFDASKRSPVQPRANEHDSA